MTIVVFDALDPDTSIMGMYGIYVTVFSLMNCNFCLSLGYSEPNYDWSHHLPLMLLS